MQFVRMNMQKPICHATSREPSRPVIESHVRLLPVHRMTNAVSLRIASFLVVAFALAAPTIAVAAPAKPVAARIVNRRGEPQQEDDVGNVQVTLSNHRKQIWTISLQCEDAKVSKSRLVGWTYARGRHSRGMWMNNQLCIARNSQDRTLFNASRAFIEVWGFTDNDTHVVMRSRNAHGPTWIEKFSIDTGRLVAECSGFDSPDTPEWARPYLDEP